MKEPNMKALIAAMAVAITLTACAQTQCVQPDPLQPSHRDCWEKGLNCGQGITNPAN